MGKSEEMRMTYSGVVPQKGGGRIVQGEFERGKDMAEGVVRPGGIGKSSGFTEEEVAQLKIYLKQQEAEILAKAKEVHPLRNWLGSRL